MPLPLVNAATGQVEDLPEGDALAALRSGKYVLRKGQTVPVVNGAGQTGALDARGLAGAGQDIRIRGAEDLARDELAAQEASDKEQYGGGGLLPNAKRAIATAEGGVRGLTMGLSDEIAVDAAQAFGGHEAAEATRKHLAGYKNANPVDAFGAEVGGALAPVILSGGGAAAGALRGAGALPRATAALGTAAEEGVGRLLGTGSSALGRIGRTALGKAAAGTVEGGAYGFGAQISEDALGDTQLTGEKAAAAIGHGMLLGGLAGGLLGGTGAALGEVRDSAGRFLSQFRSKDITSLAEKQFGYAAPGIGEAFVKASSVATGEDPAVIRKLLARRAELADVPAVRDAAAREIRTGLDTLLDSSRVISEEGKGALKADYVRRAVAKGNEAEVADAVTNQLGGLRQALEEMAANPKVFGERKLLANAVELVDGAQAKADGLMVKGGSDVNASLFTLVDDTKRAIGRWTKNLQAVERKADPLSLMRGRETRNRFMGFYEDMRKGLEDQALWGKAAEDQAAINAAWTKQIDAHRVFDARLTTNVGRDPRNPWVDIRRVDPGKADAYVSSLTNPKNDLVHQAIGNYVDSTETLAKAFQEAYELPAEKVAHVEAVAQGASSFRASVARAEDALTLANQFAALKAAESGGGLSEAATVAGALGHPIIGLLGQAVGAVARPATTIARLAALERLVGKVDARIGASVRGFFRAPEANVAGALRAGRATARANLPAVAVFAGDTRQARKESFEAEVAKLHEFASNPDRTSAGIAKSLAGLDQAAPKVSSAIAMSGARGLSFLAEKLPMGMVDTKSLQPHLEKVHLSDTEQARFGRYLAAVNDPMTVLKDLETNRLTPEGVEALKRVYPKIYEQVREEITTHLIAQKSPLPYAKRVELGVLFDVPTDATLDPEFLQAIAATRGRGDQESEGKGRGGTDGTPAPVPAKPLNVAKDFRTPFSPAPAEG